MKRMVNLGSSLRRRGAVVVLTAISIVTLLICASLAIDVGYICALTAEQQNTADAGSLSGAIALQQGDSMSARERALDIIARNQKAQGFLSLRDQIVEIGTWDSISQRFTPLDPMDWGSAFAVRVRAARNDAPLFFARLIGHHTTDVWREAVAVGSRSCEGIWGLNGVRVPGNVVTDSYISSDGPYDPITARDNGDVCSGRDIRVMGSYDINGNLMAGFGYSVDERGDAGNITGITTSTTSGVEAPPVDLEDAKYNNDNGTIGLTDDGNSPFSSGMNLRIGSHDNLTLAHGTYFFESMTFRAAASLTVTGPTTIYLTGDMDITGEGTINTPKNPADLTIISTGSTVVMTGSVEFYGSILAPFADVRLGGTSDYYGAIVGGTVTMFGDFQFHVDESLPLTKLFDPPPVMLVK